MCRITVGNKIWVENATQPILDYIRDNLVVDNPEYYKKERMGLWLGNTPSSLYLYEKDGDTLILPFGCFADLYHLCPDADYISEFSPYMALDYKSRINPYDYQEEAIKGAIRARNGIVVMPCGAGKTQTALEIIARLKGKALWLTHTQDLLNQSMSRAKSVLDVPFESYGTITGGKVNIGYGITFATVQTMAKIDLSEYKDSWDIIVVDECHKAVGSPTKCMQFYKVLSALRARYKYGITATPRRSDGLERTMFALLGNIVHEVPQEAVEDTTCDMRVQIIETGYMPSYDAVLAGDGTLNYAALVNDMIHNDDRFYKVMDVINDLPHASPVLVLANRVEYLKDMKVNYEKTGVCLSGAGQSKAAKAERKAALTALNNGEIDCVFATYQLAKEGLDVPNLRYIVFATPEKDPTTITQAAGRVRRKAPGKEYGTVIDFVDDFAMYRGWAKKREKIYKKIQKNVDILS